MSAAGAGAASGAIQGAMAGTAGGPVGMVAGAIIGGVGGFLSGSSADKAAKYAKKANKLKYQMQVRNAAIQRSQILSQFRMQRAMQIAQSYAEAGNTLSSTVQSNVGSYASQTSTSLGVFDWSAGHQKQMNKFLRKAQQAADNSQIISTATNAILSVGSAYAGFKGAMDARNIQGVQTWHGQNSASLGTSASETIGTSLNMPQYSGGYTVAPPSWTQTYLAGRP